MPARLAPFRSSYLTVAFLWPAVFLIAGCDGDNPFEAEEPSTPDAPNQTGGDDGGTAVEAGGGSSDGSASDAEPMYRSGNCMADSRYTRAVSLDDITLGHSARQVAEAFAKNGAGLLRWYDGSETLLYITADISQATVTIDDSPPYRGYCYRFMALGHVTFTVSTKDGRLDGTVVSRLIADDAGGPVLSIWPDLSLALSANRGTLQLPAQWLLPDQDRQSLGFVVNSRGNLESPYCVVGEARDETPTSGCTASSGKILYYGAKYTSATFESYVVELAGQWTWQ